MGLSESKTGAQTKENGKNGVLLKEQKCGAMLMDQKLAIFDKTEKCNVELS